MKAVRCPICGGEMLYWDVSAWWYCACTGTTIRCILPRPRSGPLNRDFEYLRQRYIDRGFGWSWYWPGSPAVITLGED